MTAAQIIHFLATSILAGILGGATMEFVMWSITRAGWAQANMLIALGSLITRSRERAWQVGAIIHAASAGFFGMVYTLVLLSIGMTYMPAALVVGIGMGFVHGMLVSLTLVWVVAGNHPIEEFAKASFAVGVAHLAGHVAFGAVVGLVVGVLPL